MYTILNPKLTWNGMVIIVILFFGGGWWNSGSKAYNVGLLLLPSDEEGPAHQGFREALQIRRNVTIREIITGSSYEASKRICKLLREGSILGIFSTYSSPMLSAISLTFDIPIIIPQDTIILHETKFNLGLNEGHWSSLLRELLIYLQDEIVALIYQNENGLKKLQTLLKEPMNLETVFIRRLDDSSSSIKDVREKVKTIFIDCNLERAITLFKQIIESDMMDHHFIFTNLDIGRLDLNPYGKLNITILSLVAPGRIPTEQALAMDSVEAFSLGLESLDYTSLRPSNLSCETATPWPHGLTLINYISSVDFIGITGRVTFREGQRSFVNVQVLRMGPTGLHSVGTWSSNLGLDIIKLFYDNSSKHDITLAVTSVLETPYVQLIPNKTGNDRFEGFSVDLLRLLANQVGFKYTLDFDKKYGAYDPDSGEWNGVVRQLMEKKADLAMGSMTINYARESVIDFTKPFMHLGISILFKVPTRTSTRPFSFFNPLAIEIWISVLISYVFVSLTMYIVARFSRQEEAIHFGFANSFWYPVGTLMQQGSDLNPRATSTRLVGGFWWFFSLVIISSYTANLAAFLTVERMSSPVESAEDLAEQSEIAYGTLDSGSTMTFFRDSKIETFQRMWRFMESRKPSVFVSSYEEGIQRVLQGNYAFLMESTMLDYVVHQNCNLTQIGGLLDSKGYGIATPIGSPWRDKISLAILEMTEKGVIQSLYTKWWRSSASGGCSSDLKKDLGASALGVDSIGGVFIILLVGLCLAVIVSICEFCIKVQKKTTSACHEMVKECQFALRCHGSNRRPALTRYCPNCSSEVKPEPPNFHDYHTYPHRHLRQLNVNGI